LTKRGITKITMPAISATMGWICAAVMTIEETSADAICESQKLYPPRRLHDSGPCDLSGFLFICDLWHCRKSPRKCQPAPGNDGQAG
jgi:hypothetical protein